MLKFHFFLKQAYKLKLFWPKVIWFIIGWYPSNWYTVPDDEINCTVSQLREALQGHFTTEGMMLKPDDTPSVSGMVSHSGRWDGVSRGQQGRAG